MPKKSPVYHYISNKMGYDPLGASEDEDGLGDDMSPYDGIARPGSEPQDIAPGSSMADAASDDTADAAPPPPQASMPGQPPAAAPVPAPPAAQDYTQDPMMKRFEQDQLAAAKYQQMRSQAQGDTNFIQGISQALQGNNTPKPNDEVFKSIAAQGDNNAKFLTDQTSAREKVIEAISKRRATDAQNSLANQIKIHGIDSRTGVADTGLQMRQELQQDRMDQAAHRSVVNKIKGDPITTQRLTQYSNLDNAVNVLMSAPITPESIHEFQQSVRSNMGIKGGGGVGEREATYMDSLGLRGKKWLELVTGEPADIAKDDHMVQHFVGLAKAEQANVLAQKDRRIQALAGGYGSMYNRRPDLKADLDDLVTSTQDQFKSSAPTAPAASPTAGGLTPEQEKRLAELRAKKAGN